MSPRYENKGDADVSRLAKPLNFEFSKKIAPNRLMKSAMSETLATWDPKDLEARGIPTKELIEVYRQWGQGGWGILETGNFMIDFEQMSNMGSSVIPPTAAFEGERFDNFKSMASLGKAHGSLVIAQVVHPGRQIPANMTNKAISASDSHLDLKGGQAFAPARAATQADINQVIEGFAHAAAFLETAGYDGIQLHAAHGYLLAQFISPTTNKRTDAYGGSVTNRARIITEISAAIRARTSPGFIVSAKLNSVEFQDEGLTPEDAAEMAQVLQGAGLDYLELSGGTFEEMGMDRKRESTRRREAFFLDFAEKIVPALGSADQRKTKVFITGGLRTANGLTAALDVVDGVGIARPATQEPSFAADLLAGRITGSIKLQSPFEEDFQLSMIASASQIRMMGKGYEPFDLSDPGVAEHFKKDIQAHHAEVAADGDKRTKYEYPAYTGESKRFVAN